MRRNSMVAGVVSLSMLAGSLPVFAAGTDSEENKKIATDLFDKGVKKMNEGRCDETPIADKAACTEARESFRRAYALYPAALGALRNLAYTEKGLGLVASASRNFRELARRAPLDPKPERHAWADFAKKEADTLEPRIPHLIVQVPSDRPTGTKLFLDSSPLEEGAWGTQIDVDPGQHEVRAEAPGRLKFVGSVALADKQTKTVNVVLEIDKNTGGIAGSGGETHSRVAPIVVATIGLVGVGVGLGLGYASLKKRDDACGGTKQCDGQALQDGRSLANASTLVTGIGAAALVGGLVWFFLSPSSSKGEDRAVSAANAPLRFAPYATPGGAGVSAFGRF